MRWREFEDDVLRHHYGVRDMLEVRQMLRGRTLGAIMKRASLLGLSEPTRTDLQPECEAGWAVPEHDVVGGLLALRLRKWRGPVNDIRPLVPTLGIVVPALGMAA